MVAAYEAGRADPFVASRLLLHAIGRDDPDEKTEAAFALFSEFMLRTIHSLTPRKK